MFAGGGAVVENRLKGLDLDGVVVFGATRVLSDNVEENLNGVGFKADDGAAESGTEVGAEARVDVTAESVSADDAEVLPTGARSGMDGSAYSDVAEDEDGAGITGDVAGLEGTRAAVTGMMEVGWATVTDDATEDGGPVSEVRVFAVEVGGAAGIMGDTAVPDDTAAPEDAAGVGDVALDVEGVAAAGDGVDVLAAELLPVSSGFHTRAAQTSGSDGINRQRPSRMPASEQNQQRAKVEHRLVLL
ncbi:hypothetical protein BV25DRAFT_1842024 [Artomyces pyxidatus]|uniref:Uncharacterized protein n=1 Tax=Artomyces pyxidatus TaxID=48021 RepID=A0ACB8SLX6_9AGAM|nr:hypothetical protein BV25DRAFT_1842024 [Artomyces pyxidatus]